MSEIMIENLSEDEINELNKKMEELHELINKWVISMMPLIERTATLIMEFARTVGKAKIEMDQKIREEK